MKKLKVLTLLLLTLTFAVSSCKKDKDDDNTNVAIVGKWKTTKEVETEYNNNVKGRVNTETSFDASDYIEYKSNGQVVYGPDVMTLTYKVEGSKITYSAGGMTLGEETIVSVSSTQLVIEETEQDGTDKYVTVTTYTKM